jgi:sec-independent protein translocase protein TatA
MHILLFDLPSGGEWILIFMAILVLFGGNKIPEFMRGLGKGIREFNDAKNNIKQEIEAGMRETPKPAQAAAPAEAPAAVEAPAAPVEHPAPTASVTEPAPVHEPAPEAPKS